MADYTQIIDLTDDKLTTLHKNLHGDIEDPAVVEAHHLVTTEMARRGLDHGHIDDAWAFAQVEVDRVESIDLENVTTELSDELAIEVAKTIGISGDVKVVLGINGYEMQIEKSQDEIDDLEFDVLAGDVEKTIRRRNGKYTVFSADGSREFGTYDSKKEAEERLAQIERFKEMDKADGYTPPAAVREAAQRALDWIGEGKAGQGFTSVGRGRARQLASGDSVGVDTLKRMRSFLARHIVDKKAEGFSRGEKGYPSPGRVAWDAWGGDAGRAWVESILDKLEKANDTEMYDPEDYLNDRQAILYATLENTVAEFGAFNEGIGADGAHYMSEENNPFASKGINCANCVFFEGGGGCEILNIEVQPMGACKFWIIPEKNLSDSIVKHEAHDQLSHGSWAGEGAGSSISSRIKNNLSRYQMQESYGQNYDEGKEAKRNAPRTGKQSYDNYKTQRNKWLKEIDEFPDRSFQAESYASLLAEAQGFMDGFDGKRPIVPIGKYSLGAPRQLSTLADNFPTIFKHGTHDQQSHGNWAGSRGAVRSSGSVSDKDVQSLKGGSAEKHLVSDGQGGFKFSGERQALHDSIVQEALSGVPKSSDPTFFMLGGGPASGKSSLITRGDVAVPNTKNDEAVLVNPDDYKVQLPEYKTQPVSNAANFTHEESSYIAKRIQNEAFANGQDIVLDGTGNSSFDKASAKVQRARDNGYKIKGYYATVSIAEALRRNDARARATGRKVIPSVLIETHASVSRVFPRLSAQFDEVKLFDTTSGVKLLAQRSRGSELDIRDSVGYNNFLAKAGIEDQAYIGVE
jgi:hypothetical protein